MTSRAGWVPALLAAALVSAWGAAWFTALPVDAQEAAAPSTETEAKTETETKPEAGPRAGGEAKPKDDMPMDDAADMPTVQDSPLAPDYGFLPTEIFKIDDRVQNLKHADFNGDGREDLAIVDNGKSQIVLLIQRTDKAADAPVGKVDVNELSDSWRFEKKRIPVDVNIDCMIPGDFDGDRRADLAYIGENQLYIRHNTGDDWKDVHKLRLTDGSLPTSWQITAGDLEGDGKLDIVALGNNETLICRGTAGKPSKLERLSNSSGNIAFVWALDINGDRRSDLIYWTSEEGPSPIIVRLQDATGRFGPEYRLTMPIPRAVDFADLDGKPGVELLSLEKNTGRMRVFRMEPSDENSESPTSPLVQFGFGRSEGGRSRLLTTGDINGDGRLDVLVADGDAGLMTVYLQDPKSGLTEGVTFPGLTGLRGVVLADVDGDKKAEVFLASEREKVVAMSRWRDERLTFPEALPSADPPMAICLADFEGMGRLDLAYIASKRAATGRGDYVLRKLVFDRNEGWKAGDFAGQTEVALEGLRSAPAELMATDADRDGRDDLIILSSNSPAMFLLTDGRGQPQIMQANTSDRLGNIGPGQFTVGNLDGPAMLVSQRNFARRVALDMNNQWSVVDQYNAESPSATIAGTAIIDLDGDKQAEIVLVDTGTKRLRFLKKEDGVYRAWKELEIGYFGYKSLAVGDFNSDGKDDLLLFAADKFGIAYTGQSGPVLTEINAFESKVKDARLQDLVQGDLGGGEEPEIALLDGQENRVQIISLRDETWQSALTFKVFETGPNQSGGGEPRESMIADVTGDGLDDLLLLVQDRILLFPQDAGPGVEAPKAAATEDD